MATNFFEKASLVLIPSGYKAGKLYSVKPDDGSGDFTFARTTTATRTNSAGQIETVGTDVPRLQYPSCPSLLLEPARTNLVTYSEQFDTGWTTQAATVTSGFIAPDGSSNAWKLAEDDTETQHWVRRTGVAIPNGVDCTISCFAKAGERDWLFLYGNNFDSRAYFDLKNGVVGTVIAGTASIEDWGNGWYRCIITNTTINVSSAVNIQVAESDNTILYQGDGSSGIYIWGVQGEEGSYPTSYIKTEASTVNRGIDTCSVATSGILGTNEGTIAEQYDADKYAYRYTSDGNMETYKNGASEGTEVAALPATYNLKNPGEYQYVYMFNTPLTDQEMVDITT